MRTEGGREGGGDGRGREGGGGDGKIEDMHFIYLTYLDHQHGLVKDVITTETVYNIYGNSTMLQ